jgi:MFS family permease
MNDPKLGKSFGRLWIVFFFQGMSPGFWLPALTNILKAEELAGWVPLAFIIAPVCALISPLIGGALADQRVAANRLYVGSSLVAAVMLALAFWSLENHWNPWWFIGFLGMYSLASGPMWGLLATISLSHLPNGEKQFPLVRMGATLGWVVAGLVASYVLRVDVSPSAGYAGAVARLVACGFAIFLPNTPPLGRARSWKGLLGFDAFKLLKERDHCVFFVVTTVFSIPLAAFYMYAPEHLRMLGNERPTATMTIAQLSEIAAMFLVGGMMGRFRVKTVLLWALGMSVVRFGMSAYAGFTDLENWHITGIALHGVCYTFYFITAQVFLDRRVEPGLRGQAQGLLALVSGGLGPFIGAYLCGWLRATYVGVNGEGWLPFWGILASIIAICFLGFAVFYRGLAGKSVEESDR